MFKHMVGTIFVMIMSFITRSSFPTLKKCPVRVVQREVIERILNF